MQKMEGPASLQKGTRLPKRSFATGLPRCKIVQDMPKGFLQRGFTLVEFILVMVIIGIIIGIATPFLVEITNDWLMQIRRNELSESARIAMDRMIRETRETKSLTSAQVNFLRFTDIDNRDITFSVSGTTLNRTVSTTANALASNVSSLEFYYYNTNLVLQTPPIADLSVVKVIEVKLTLSLGGNTLYFWSQVSPRRLQ